MLYLVQLVNRRTDGTEILRWHATCLKHAVQQLAMIQLDHIVPNVEGIQHLGHYLDALGIRQHGIVGAGNIEITLIELTVATPSHGGIITTIDLGNVISLNAGYLVHGQIASQRNS